MAQAQRESGRNSTEMQLRRTEIWYIFLKNLIDTDLRLYYNISVWQILSRCCCAMQHENVQ